VIMTFLMKEKYTLKNARRRREFRKYAEVILRAAKSAELIPKISQIFLIYNEIDVEFQRNISMLKTDTKLNSFLTNLNDRKNV
jgi:DNA/RNA endonuclease YhcR with UshA esterase domain